MPDFGDEAGGMLGRGASGIFRYFLQQLQRGNYQRHVADYTDEQADPAKQTICTIPFETEQERDIIAKALEGQGIPFDSTVITSPALAFRQSDIGKIQTVIEDRIKSHDGMDLDPHSAVNEVDTMEERGLTGAQASPEEFSWKEDIQARVAEARERSSTLDQFIESCEDRGLTVDRATDGELMFIHPGQGNWKVRGDTLGDQFSRHSFEHKPVRLEQEAKDMREASKQLSAEKELLSRDRDVPNLQSLSK